MRRIFLQHRTVIFQLFVVFKDLHILLTPTNSKPNLHSMTDMYQLQTFIQQQISTNFKYIFNNRYLPNFFHILLLGSLLSSVKRKNEAIDHYREVTRLSPNNYEGNKGRSHLQSNFNFSCQILSD